MGASDYIVTLDIISFAAIVEVHVCDFLESVAVRDFRPVQGVKYFSALNTEFRHEVYS